MASVVGTDVPAAALVVAALALLVVLAPRRPWTAAVIFGVTMGLAAWIRAVALPLTALSAGVWLARRQLIRRALLLTGAWSLRRWWCWPPGEFGTCARAARSTSRTITAG